MRIHRSTPLTRPSTWVLLAAGLALAGCGADLEPDPTGPIPTPTPGASKVSVLGRDGDVARVRVDATANDAWVYVDLETMTQVIVDDPGRSTAWDVAFSRFHVKVNGGVSGAGGVEVAALPGRALAAVTTEPTEGWGTDAPKVGVDAPDQPSFVTPANADLVFGRAHAASATGWYVYDVTTHVLRAADVTYVVRTVEGALRKVRFEGYYDDAGTGGFPRLVVAPLAAAGPLPSPTPTPEPTPTPTPTPSPTPTPAPGTLVVDAAGAEWVYVSLEAGVLGAAATPPARWDLAVQRTRWRTASGTSDAGRAGARWVPGARFEDLTEAPTAGFAIDAEVPLPGPPGAGRFSGSPVLNAWYDYDPTTHAVSPKAGVFLVRGQAGEYAKLAIERWYSGVYTLRLSPLAARPDVVRLTVTATDARGFVGVDLDRLGTEAPAVAALDALAGAWDLAFSRTRVRTHSGTSGDGRGGALALDGQAFEAVAEAPSDGYVVDTALPLPGPPGAGTYSGNPALATWFDYDPVTHAVTPRATTFVVRTRRGEWLKLAVESYAGGTYGLVLSLAAPGARALR